MTHKELIEKLVFHTNANEIIWQQPVNTYGEIMGHFQAAFCGLRLWVKYQEFEKIVIPRVAVGGYDLGANVWPLLEAIHAQRGQEVPLRILEHLFEEPC